MMDELIREVQASVENEYGRAAARFGETNNSNHESYAVILEEFQEALNEESRAGLGLNVFWDAVKCDEPDQDKVTALLDLQARATLAACEFIQVAAMARKAVVTINQKYPPLTGGCG